MKKQFNASGYVVADHRITLQSGRHFDFSRPLSNEIEIEDIAHGLAHTCRYAGQCKVFFSVAEHSVLVSYAASKFGLEGLFHDAAEALVGDMPAPLKKLLPGYKAIEEQIQRLIFENFKISWPLPPEIKQADLRVMAAELAVLMPAGTNEWLNSRGITAADVDVKCLDPASAKKLFLDRYRGLAKLQKPSVLRLSA